MRARWISYVALIAAGAVLVVVVLAIGARWFAPSGTDGAATLVAASRAARGANLVTQVLLALATVVVVSRGLGAIFHRLGQPAVIGEIVAGILLGPSALGWAAPALARFLIPPDSIPILGVISQLGVILFMFLVGLQLDASGLRRRSDAALAIAHASIVVPFALGAALALLLYEPYGVSGVPFAPFALFLGVAMSITAFPVLARILAERGLQKTALGTLALTVAAVGDVTAWLLLAFVVGVVRAEIGGVVATLGLTLLYIAGLWWVVRPLLGRLLAQQSVAAGSAAALVCLLLAALAAEAIGIHAVFGAFLIGVVIASVWPPAPELVARTEAVTMVLFLPAFFAVTGLRTEVGLLATVEDWLFCGLIIVVATVGKFGGTLAGAMLARVGWREGGRLGILMNTRGLMELIVLNVALDLGILSPTLFGMLVLMAIATTVITVPLLDLFGSVEAFERQERAS